MCEHNIRRLDLEIYINNLLFDSVEVLAAIKIFDV